MTNTSIATIDTERPPSTRHACTSGLQLKPAPLSVAALIAPALAAGTYFEDAELFDDEPSLIDCDVPSTIRPGLVWV